MAAKERSQPAAHAAPPPAVWVVVLGDFGRSPRMQYHALSLSQHGYDVHVVASAGAPPIQPLREASNVHLHHLPQPPAWLARLPTLLALLLKAAHQLLTMLWLMLLWLRRPTTILVQNPPAIPALLVCWAAAARHRSQLIIDWHNLAYSIMQYKYGKHGWLIRLARSYECTMGRRAHAHFCVTRAMKDFLAREFGVQATVLYDRPPAMFRPGTPASTHELLGRLQRELLAGAVGGQLAQALQQQSRQQQQQQGREGEGSSTLLTHVTAGGAVAMRPQRPMLVVSSTSWTPDEDFGILLEAAVAYDAAAASAASGASGSSNSSRSSAAGSREAAAASLPDVLFVITGRGPQRQHYLERLQQLSLQHVAFVSAWLEPEDYPKLLAAADLGVCLHTSSSGLDLPMKVVDMFGAGLPVCAVAYDCIDELVAHGRTGLLFGSAGELAQQLQLLLRIEGAANGNELAAMRAAVVKEHASWGWEGNWDKVAAPIFAAAASCSRPSAGERAGSSAESSRASSKASRRKP